MVARGIRPGLARGQGGFWATLWLAFLLLLGQNLAAIHIMPTEASGLLAGATICHVEGAGQPSPDHGPAHPAPACPICHLAHLAGTLLPPPLEAVPVVPHLVCAALALVEAARWQAGSPQTYQARAPPLV